MAPQLKELLFHHSTIQLEIRAKVPYITIPVQSIIDGDSFPNRSQILKLRMTFSCLPLRSMPIYFFSLLLSLLYSSTLLWAAEPASWKTPSGYGVKIDTTGWSFPVGIQFVTAPQNDPKAPLYYVAERQGLIKVVTKDRSIFVYTDQRRKLVLEEPSSQQKQQTGLVGLCLDQTTGDVYATLIYHKAGQLLNKIMRFGKATGQFSLQGDKTLEITDLFLNDLSSPLPRLGSCWVGSDQKLYVGLSDGAQPQKAQMLPHLNGKILRINLDGTAPTDNPFYDPQAQNHLLSHIYASGLRRPLALTEDLNAQLYAIDNGLKAGRLIQVVPGRNYLWDGKNSSILMKSIVTWSLASIPESLTFLGNHPHFSQWNQHLLVASSRRIEAIPVDPQWGATAPPQTILEYIDNQKKEKPREMLVSVGPDGIYFSNVSAQIGRKTPILKIVQDSSQRVSSAQPNLSGEAWFARLECAACHKIAGKGGPAGPALDDLIPRLDERLNSQSYKKQLDHMDQLTEALFVQYKEVRQKLRRFEGKEKIELWLESRLKEPRFDAVDSQMPNLHLKDEQIAALVEYLMTLSAKEAPPQEKTLKQWAADFKFYLTTHLWIWLSITLVLGLMLGFSLKMLFRFLRK